MQLPYQVRHNPLQNVLVSDVLGNDLHHLKHLQLGGSKLVRGTKEVSARGKESGREGGTCAALMCAVMAARTIINTSARYVHKAHINVRQMDRWQAWS